MPKKRYKTWSDLVRTLTFILQLKFSPARNFTSIQKQLSSTQKPFIYPTETEQCLPQNLASSSQIGDPETCNCDVIVLSFKAKRPDNNQYT